jgi:hypothetical protein
MTKIVFFGGVIVLSWGTSIGYSQDLPDLFIKNYSFSPKNLNVGDTLHVSGVIKNEAFIPAFFSSGNGLGVYLSSDSTYSFDDLCLETYHVNSVPESDPNNPNTGIVNFSISIKINEIATSKPSYIILFIDNNEEIFESCESNNLACFQINSTQAKPDLIIQNPFIHFWGPSGNPEFCNVNCSIKNQGNAMADFQSQRGISFYYSLDGYLDANDILLGFLNVDTIGYGRSLSISTTVNLPLQVSSQCYIIFYVDSDNRVAELIESNNISICSRILIITGPSTNLSIQNPSGDPLNIYPGDSVTVGCTISCSGDFPSFFIDNQHGLYYFISNNKGWGLSDITIGTSWVNDLGPGQNYQISGKKILIPSTLSPGIYFILFYVDKENDVLESSEADNIASIQIDIKKSVGDGLENTRAKNFKIYPNPNNGKFRIEIDSDIGDSFLFSIFNNIGVKIYENKGSGRFFSNNEAYFDLPLLPNGYYIILLRGKNHEYKSRLVINK